MEKIISCCGLVCSNCGAYLATQQNDLQGLKRVAEEWSKEFHTSFKPEDCVCDGCMAGTGRICSYGPACEIRACGLKHQVANCAHCPEYACARLEGFFANVPAAKATLEEVRASLR